MASTTSNYIAADGVNIFYREAGPKTASTILLLHGYPSSSHQFRNLIPLLSQRYHVVAPDLPGFGFTEVPENRGYTYTFENLTTSIEAFVDALNLKRFSIYIFDYGAPVGLRLALRRPGAVQTIITQSGNAYDEGLGSFWRPLQKWWQSGSAEEREILRSSAFTFDAMKGKYTIGTDKTVAPEAYYLDFALLERPGNQDVQLSLFYDYQENVRLYPQFHEYFEKSKVPVLAVWGKNDPIFIPQGAEAFKKHTKAEVHLLDAGHFAIETDTSEIADLMLKFLTRNGI